VVNKDKGGQFGGNKRTSTGDRRRKARRTGAKWSWPTNFTDHNRDSRHRLPPACVDTCEFFVVVEGNAFHARRQVKPIAKRGRS
jgi:hypothetical protein